MDSLPAIPDENDEPELSLTNNEIIQNKDKESSISN